MDSAINLVPPPAHGQGPAGSPPDLARAAWRCVEIRSDADLAAVVETLAPLSALDPLAGLERNPTWLAASRCDPGDGPLAFLLEADGAVLGYAFAVTVKASPWYVEAGPYLVMELSVGRYNCEAGPFFDPRLGAPGDHLVLGWLELLRGRLTGRTMVGLNCVPADSPLIAATASRALRSAGYRLLPHGEVKQRRVMALPESFEDYLNSLGRSTRQTLNRRHRKLAEEHDVKLEIATGLDQVEAVFEGAVEVSRKTYQWEREIGLNETERVRRGMEAAAREGRLRWYLLRCDGQPVAFMSGYLSGDRFIWPDLGFDPAWSDKAAGLVLQYLVIKDLIETMPGVRRYDCGTLDTENKRRLVKTTTEEHHLFLVPTTPFGTALWSLTELIQGGTALAKRALVGYRHAAGLARRLTERAGGKAVENAAPSPVREDAGRTVAATSTDGVQVSVYDDVSSLPEVAKALMAEEGRKRFMNGLDWYRTFAATCLEAGQTPRFYVMTSKGAPAARLIMPMVTPLGRPGSRITERRLGRRTLMAMTNHQTRQFGPISDAEPAMRRKLLDGFAQHLKREGCSTVDVNHLDPDIPGTESILPALAVAGFAVQRYHDQTIVLDRFEGRSFADFLGDLSSKKRSNMRRERKKLESLGALRLDVLKGGDGLERAIDDYQAVQKASWKPDEIHAEHVPALIRAAADAGSLRLSILYLDDRPVGADLTFVSGGQAYGHKVHFDDAMRQHHVGDVLIGMHLENLLDRDKVEIIDFGKNATSYKLKWLKQQLRLDGVVAFNPATVDGQLQRLIYSTRSRTEAQLSALKRRLEGSKVMARVIAARKPSDKG
jgi:CelD/BcsL family acetyltransferase involved in cellulose biosynthesis